MVTREDARERVAQALRVMRAVKPFSLKWLSETAGIEEGTLGTYFAGTRAVPGPALYVILEAIAEHRGKAPKDLWGEFYEWSQASIG